MQATVRSHDPTTGCGTILTDDGLLLEYSGQAFAASGLRHLRLGQRVRIEVAGDGENLAVSSIALYTMP